VRDGDLVRCDVEGRRLHLDVEEGELKRRLEERRREMSEMTTGVIAERGRRRGYRGLYERTVNQAHEGADFDFLTAEGPVGQA